MGLPEDLRRWTAAGILTAELADRIAHFEADRPAPAAEPSRAGRSITATEVVAYSGTIVILVGWAFLFGVQHDQLGNAGRILLLGLVLSAGLGTGFLLEPRSAQPAARRARSAAFALSVLAVFATCSEIFIDMHLLSRASQSTYSGPDESGNLLLAAAIGWAVAIPLMLRTWSGLVALTLAICAYSSAGAAIAYARLPAGWEPEVAFIIAGAVLAISAEMGRERKGAWAVEVLSLTAVIPPVVAALILSSEPGGRSLESFAAGLAMTSFAASIVRSSGGYAVAGGVGLFITTLEVGFRHFAQSLGFPIVLIASGIVLLAVAAALVRLLPRLARNRLGRGHLGGDGVDLGQQLGE